MRAMPDLRILVTGFEPFGGDSVNPSWLVAQHLSRASIAGAQLMCARGRSQERAEDAALQQADVEHAGGPREFTVQRVWRQGQQRHRQRGGST